MRVGAPTRLEESATKTKLQKLAKTEDEAEVSLALQLGLKVRRVILDPGHGGHDTGAIGAQGTREKDIALAISQRLRTKLEEDPRSPRLLKTIRGAGYMLTASDEK